MSVESILWLVFAAASALTISLGAILAYHWLRFAMNNAVAFGACIVFAAVSGALLLLLTSIILVM